MADGINRCRQYTAERAHHGHRNAADEYGDRQPLDRRVLREVAGPAYRAGRDAHVQHFDEAADDDQRDAHGQLPLVLGSERPQEAQQRSKANQQQNNEDAATCEQRRKHSTRTQAGHSRAPGVGEAAPIEGAKNWSAVSIVRRRAHVQCRNQK